MPSIAGGSSTGIDYAPHMYVLREGGNSSLDSDFIFVGNAEVSWNDESKLGDTYKEIKANVAKLATEVFFSTYHIGISATDGLVGDVTATKLEIVGSDNYLKSTFVEGSHKGIPASDIPKEAKTQLILVGVRQISTLSGQMILGGMGIDLPDGLEALDFRKIFSGTPAEQANEREKEEQWQQVAEAIIKELDII